LGIKRGDAPRLYYALILVSEYAAYRNRHNFKENLLRPIEVLAKERTTLEEYQSLYASANEEGVINTSIPASVTLDIPAISVVDYEEELEEGSTIVNPEITVAPNIQIDVPEIAPQITVTPNITVDVPKLEIPDPNITVNIPEIVIPEPTVINLEKQAPLLEQEEDKAFSKLPREYIGGSPKAAFSEISVIRN